MASRSEDVSNSTADSQDEPDQDLLPDKANMARQRFNEYLQQYQQHTVHLRQYQQLYEEQYCALRDFFELTHANVPGDL